VHQRHLARAPFDHVDDEPHGRHRREDPFLLGDVLLEDVGLHGPAQLGDRHPLLLADAGIEREQHRRRRVDRHRGRDVSERDPRKKRLHVVERVDRNSLATHLAERSRMIRVVAHQRRHVEGRRKPGLPVLEQVAEALVRLGRRPETRELAHRPQSPAIHRRIDAARERVDAGVAEVEVVVEGGIVRRVERLVLDSGDRREELAGALGARPVQLVAPLLGRRAPLRLDAGILGRRHLAGL
jgi:hypothetical protein